MIGVMVLVGCPDPVPDPGSGEDATDRAMGLVTESEEDYASLPVAEIPLQGTLPSSVNLSSDMPPVKSQGGQGSCTAWAVGYALKTYQEKREHGWDITTKSHQFSPAYLYNMTKSSDCSGGAKLTTVLEYVKDNGCCTLDKMSYTDKSCSANPSSEAVDEAQDFRIKSYQVIPASQIRKASTFKSHLAAGYPVVLGITVDDAFHKNKLSGAVYSAPGDEIGRHAVCMVGYDDSRSRFKVMNSWGTDWGENGYFYIPYSSVSLVIMEAYIAEDATSDVDDDALNLTLFMTGQGTLSTTPSGGSYEKGTDVQIMATPSTGWKFDHWTDGLTGTNNPGTVAMDDDKTVTAVFVKIAANQYNVIAEVSGKGTVSLSPSGGAYDAGTQVTLTATPVSGWVFDHWEGDASGSANPLAITVGVDTTITAVFVENTKKYTLTSSVEGSGSVRLNPTGGTYSSGTTVTVKAIAATGWKFKRWDGDLSGNDVTETVTMSGNKSITAIFAEIPTEVHWQPDSSTLALWYFNGDGVDYSENGMDLTIKTDRVTFEDVTLYGQAAVLGSDPYTDPALSDGGAISGPQLLWKGSSGVLTIEGWFHIPDRSGSYVLVDAWNCGPGRGYKFYIASERIYLDQSIGAGSGDPCVRRYATLPSDCEGRWVWLGVELTVSGDSEATFYIDGDVLDVENTRITTTDDTLEEAGTYIGGTYCGTSTGLKVDEVRISKGSRY
jgi:hypothetical protein